jgi:diphosphomevalonate decarboxylase
MKKTTVISSGDIALIKYWGKKDEVLRLPENGSIALKLSDLTTTTTVEFDENLTEDDITIEGKSDSKESSRATKHLNRIRKLAGKEIFAKVVSENSFPKGTGLSSSASGFSALTVAATKAIGLDLSTKELSILSRQGSGSSCRCVEDGFVEWLDGDTSEDSYAVSLHDHNYWDIRDIVVVVDEGMKKVSSTQGHTAAHTSPFFEARQERIHQKIELMKKYIDEKDFEKMGMLAEKEALEFHSILLTSDPVLIAWYPGTIEVMLAVQNLREKGIPAYFTINTGFNVHVLTLPKYEDKVIAEMKSLKTVKKVLTSKIGGKPEVIDRHLF